jgi:hypothetical protein
MDHVIFFVASSIVVFALLYALIKWTQIRKCVALDAERASGFFITCFALYAVGQTIVIIQYIGLLKGIGDVSEYMYALAAILFAVGSNLQYKSVTGK